MFISPDEVPEEAVPAVVVALVELAEVSIDPDAAEVVSGGVGMEVTGSSYVETWDPRSVDVAGSVTVETAPEVWRVPGRAEEYSIVSVVVLDGGIWMTILESCFELI